MNCPAEGYSQAKAYLIISAIGFPFIFGYNAICGILRGMGEYKRPLLFIIIAASVNIVTDTLFVVVFRMEAAGTAIATVLSQIGSCVAAFYFLYQKREHFGFELSMRFLKIRAYAAKTIIRLAIPQIARTMLVRSSMLYVNANCNAFGAAYSQTNSIGNKIQKFLEVFMQGIDSASASMIGQNLGAKKQDRAAKTVWSTLAMCMIVAVCSAIIRLLLPKQFFALFTNEPTVIDLLYNTCYLLDRSLQSNQDRAFASPE